MSNTAQIMCGARFGDLKKSLLLGTALGFAMAAPAVAQADGSEGARASP